MPTSVHVSQSDVGITEDLSASNQVCPLLPDHINDLGGHFGTILEQDEERGEKTG